METQSSRYHDKNYDSEANVAIEPVRSKGPTEGRCAKWFRCISGKVILVILMMGLFIVARTFRLPAKWQKNSLHNYNTSPNLDTTKVTQGLQSLWNYDVPFFPQAPALAISVAVSRDPDSNIQLYNLDTSGVLRVRRRTNSNDPMNTKWTSPQIIPTDPRPRPYSPLAAIAFQFQAGVTVSYKGPSSTPLLRIGEILVKNPQNGYTNFHRYRSFGSTISMDRAV